MAQVLLFNLDAAKRSAMLPLLLRLKIAVRDVPPEQQGRSIGTLTGRAGYPDPGDAARFTDELLVMDSLDAAQFHGLLDGLRQARATVALKAVTTEQNLTWSAARLHREIAAEHAALQ